MSVFVHLPVPVARWMAAYCGSTGLTSRLVFVLCRIRWSS